MKIPSKDNFVLKKTVDEVSLISIPNVANLMLHQRKKSANKLLVDCKQYVSSQEVTDELQERIDALKAQDETLSTVEIIVILLDFVERETVAIEKLEKNELNFLEKIKKIIQKII